MGTDLTCSMDLCCSNGWSLTGLFSIFLVSLLSPVLLLTVYLKQAVQQLSIHGGIPVSPGPRVCERRLKIWEVGQWEESGAG